MNKIVKIAAATALVAASASAWWNSPFTTFTGEFFGDSVGDGTFDMNMNASTRTFGRGYGYNRYIDGPYAYPYAPVAPVAPIASVAQAAVTK